MAETSEDLPAKIHRRDLALLGCGSRRWRRTEVLGVDLVVAAVGLDVGKSLVLLGLRFGAALFQGDAVLLGHEVLV